MRPRPAALASTACAFVFGVALPRVALAQNQDSFFFSDEASMMAGAVVARPADASGVYYNPASLGALRHPRVTVSGSVFGLRFRKHPDALVTEVGDGESHLALDSTSYVATPTGIALTYDISSRVAIGAGLFTTARDIENATDEETTSVLVDGAPATVLQRVDLQLDRQKMIAGLAFGVTVAEGFRIGGGLFGTYTSLDASAELLNQVSFGGPLPTLDSIDIDAAVSSIGILPTLGFQWDATPHVHLGVDLKLPEIALSSTSEGGVATIQIVPGPAPTGGLVIQKADDSGGVEVLAGPRIALGATFDVSPKLEVGLGVDASTGVSTEAFALDQKGVVNVRVGAKWQPFPELALGAGAFTDLSNHTRLADGLGERSIDYVGGTFGGSLMTPLRIVDRPADDPVVVATTVSVRYAVGVGSARTLRITEAGTEADKVGVVIHDLMPYLGTSISL